MRLLAAVALVVVLAGCGSTRSDSTSSAVLNNERTVGSDAVLERIENSTDCAALRREWRNAMGNAGVLIDSGGDASVPLEYAGAANARQSEIGCFE